jgi:deoxyribonuclease-4
MSIAGGMSKAIERAVAVQATALQVFVKSSNQWAARPFVTGEVDAYRRAALAADLAGHTLAHASYLINLASPDPVLWEKSVSAFRIELDRCDALGIPWLVVHPGSHVGSGVQAGVARVAQALQIVLPKKAVPGAAGVLIENTAGQGNSLGSKADELAEILKLADRPESAGVCFDTCHALAAGYDVRDANTYAQTMSVFDRAVGLERIKGFHLNDSRGDLGMRKDRHEHIGRGKLGLEPFRLLLSDARFAGTAMVLETDKGEDLAEDRMNLGVLRSLVRT